MRSLPIKYWERRYDRLLKEADALEDLNYDVKVLRQQRRLYQEAALIGMMLSSFSSVLDKIISEVRSLQKQVDDQ